MKRVEWNYDMVIESIEVIPKDWFSKLLLKLAKWKYRVRFKDRGVQWDLDPNEVRVKEK